MILKLELPNIAENDSQMSDVHDFFIKVLDFASFLTKEHKISSLIETLEEFVEDVEAIEPLLRGYKLSILPKEYDDVDRD